jgi:hypothetical protein
MNKGKTFFFLFLIVSATKLFSQQKDSTKVIIYEPFKSGRTIDPKKDIKIDKNCLKWNWSLLARGVFAINYERLITHQLTYQLGVGLTYRDFMYELGQDGETYDDGYNVNVKIGPYVEGSLRFYPSEGDLEGFYLSPYIRYRNYNVEKKMEDNYYTAGYTMTDIGFNIGVQREVWYTGIMVESYFGVAYRYREADQPYVDYGTTTVVVQDRTKKWIPAITLGFVIGVPF